jgi:hypothetical protein
MPLRTRSFAPEVVGTQYTDYVVFYLHICLGSAALFILKPTSCSSVLVRECCRVRYGEVYKTKL